MTWGSWSREKPELQQKPTQAQQRKHVHSFLVAFLVWGKKLHRHWLKRAMLLMNWWRLNGKKITWLVEKNQKSFPEMSFGTFVLVKIHMWERTDNINHTKASLLADLFFKILMWITFVIPRNCNSFPRLIWFLSSSSSYITCPAYASIRLDTTFTQTAERTRVFQNCLLALIFSSCCRITSQTFNLYPEQLSENIKHNSMLSNSFSH